MKGYNKNLKAFIEYVLGEYGGDKHIAEFRAIYESRKQEKLAKKASPRVIKPKEKMVNITEKTAKLCQKLIWAESTRYEIMGYINVGYKYELDHALDELNDKLIKGKGDNLWK